MMVNIRAAEIGDAPAIAHVHVNSWRTTYPGLMPAEILKNLSVERRENYWRNVLSQTNASEFVYVADVEGVGVVGFASGGPERSQHEVYKGELYAIYLLQEHQSKGIGRGLFDAVVKHLAAQGHDSMMLWVLKDNPAMQFYAAMGGVQLGEKNERLNDEVLTEFSYGWDDIGALASR